MKHLLSLSTLLTLCLSLNAFADEKEVIIPRGLVDATVADIVSQQEKSSSKPRVRVKISPTFFLPAVESKSSKPSGIIIDGQNLPIDFTGEASFRERVDTIEPGGEISGEVEWDTPDAPWDSVYVYSQYSHTEFPMEGEAITPLGVIPVDVTVNSDQFEFWLGMRKDINNRLRADVFLGGRMIRTDIESDSVLGRHETANDLDEVLFGGRLEYHIYEAISAFALYSKSKAAEEFRVGASLATTNWGIVTLEGRRFHLESEFDIGNGITEEVEYTLKGPALTWSYQGPLLDRLLNRRKR